MSLATVYLITGANRGLSLVGHILTANESAFVYAGVRDPPAASALIELQKKHSARLSIIKYIAADAEVNKSLAKEIESGHGHVDTVIANSGISKSWSMISEVTLSEMNEHFQVNVNGSIVLFQAINHLLKKSSNPRFITISSSAGRLGCENTIIQVGGVGSVAYGASKAALNWVTRKLHYENDWLITFPICPGGVDTDMFQTNITNDKSGVFTDLMSNYEIATTSDTAPKLLKIIDQSTRESAGGQFFFVNGAKLEW